MARASYETEVLLPLRAYLTGRCSDAEWLVGPIASLLAAPPLAARQPSLLRKPPAAFFRLQRQVWTPPESEDPAVSALLALLAYRLSRLNHLLCTHGSSTWDEVKYLLQVHVDAHLHLVCLAEDGRWAALLARGRYRLPHLRHGYTLWGPGVRRGVLLSHGNAAWLGRRRVAAHRDPW